MKYLLPCLVFMALGCTRVNRPVPVSEPIQEVIEECGRMYGSDKVSMISVLDEDDDPIPRSMNVVFKNSSFVSLEDGDLDGIQAKVLDLILQRTADPDSILDLVEITFSESSYFFIGRRKKEIGVRYENAHMRSLYDHLHSPSYLFDARLKGLIKDDRFSEVLLLCDSALRTEANHAVALQYKGLVRLHEGDTLAAIECYLATKQTMRHDSNVFLNIAILYTDIREYQLAAAYLDTALSMNSSDTRAIYYHGVLRLVAGDTTGACEDFKTTKDLGSAIAANDLMTYCD
ncbi:MAG: hypothetical protein KDB87_06840 [Flavobacteriales bacterium]|nr:hypothetical protein [Flavobacteriales bacterium]MCB0784160.1 hypothetical protein [Flavobacteriales bacterium]MCB0812864.1 hypothetical protein [Flavobacteriales bacterium]